MGENRNRSNDPVFVIIIGLISMFLFIFAGNSIFASDIFGLIQAAAIGFGIGFVSALSRNRRPSRIWAADIIGSFLGLVIGVILIRVKTHIPIMFGINRLYLFFQYQQYVEVQYHQFPLLEKLLRNYNYGATNPRLVPTWPSAQGQGA